MFFPANLLACNEKIKINADVVPNTSHYQITRSTRFARNVGIIKPTSNPNPKTLTLTLNLTVTKEINIK